MKKEAGLGLSLARGGDNARTYSPLNSREPEEDDPEVLKGSKAGLRFSMEDPYDWKEGNSNDWSVAGSALDLKDSKDRKGESSQSGRSASMPRAAELRRSMGTQAFNLTLAGAKLIGGLHCLKTSQLGIERGSVYGATILVPQLARTLQWPRLLSAISVRVYGFLFLCIGVHAGLLTLIMKQELVVDAFAGQPYLCDFGTICDGEDLCRGPGGTKNTPERVYGFGDWVTRNFVKDSLKAILPEKIEEINSSIDPGEYGAETNYGRLLCCFIFITALDPELELVLNLGRLLWHCPSDGPWLSLKEDHDPSSSKSVSASWWLDHVIVKVGGMPLRWKIFNASVVLFPKVVLWALTIFAGINFLMETAVIDDVIVNACALGFLLSLDNMIIEAFASVEVKCLMERCEDMVIDGAHPHSFEEDDILSSYHFDQQDSGWTFCNMVQGVVPWKLVRVILLWILCVLRYYHAHCLRQGGIWVSKPLYLPKSYEFWFSNAFTMLWPVAEEETPSWTMPK